MLGQLDRRVGAVAVGIAPRACSRPRMNSVKVAAIRLCEAWAAGRPGSGRRARSPAGRARALGGAPPVAPRSSRSPPAGRGWRPGAPAAARSSRAPRAAPSPACWRPAGSASRAAACRPGAAGGAKVPARPRLDHVQRGQRLHRLAHRGAADAQPLGQLALGRQPVARGERPRGPCPAAARRRPAPPSSAAPGPARRGPSAPLAHGRQLV